MSNVQVADMAEIDVATPTKLLFVAAAAFVGRIAWRLGDLLSDWVTDWLRDGSTIDFAAAGEAFGTLDESIFDRY